MGILNLTPDSFSDGLPNATLDDFLVRARQLIEDGCDLLDIGGESTRPGAKVISVEEESSRVLPFLKAFRREFKKFPISLDTRKFEVAMQALEYNIQVLNDTDFLQDVRLLDLARQNDLFYVLMHCRGTPQEMTSLTDYEDGLLPSLFQEFEKKIVFIKERNFPLENLILDPGFGFAKTPEQCREMMMYLEAWQRFSLPLMIGISRKRFLQFYTGENKPQDRDDISAKLAKIASEKGFCIIRTHNVSLTKKVFQDTGLDQKACL